MFEGPYTKLGAIAGALAVVVAIVALIVNVPGSEPWSPPAATSTSAARPPSRGLGPPATTVKTTEATSPLTTAYIEDLPYTADSEGYSGGSVEV